MFRSFRVGSIALAAVLLLAPSPGRSAPEGRAAPALPGDVSWAGIDANRIAAYVTNAGAISYLGNLDDMRATSTALLFWSGLWLGGTVNGAPRLALSEYTSEFAPGAMVAGAADDPNRPEYKVYKIAPWTGNPADSAYVFLEGRDWDLLAHHSWSEYMAGAVPHGAPWRYWRLPVTSTPAPDDSVDVPGPDVKGDQMLWSVFNDADPSRHVSPAGGTLPLGLEVRQSVFAFDRPDAIGNTVFLRWDVFNRGGNDIPDLRMGFWSDPDIGENFRDDLSGCDTTRSVAFAYSTLWGSDPAFGYAKPAVGIDFLSAHDSPALLRPSGFDAFVDYVNGSDPGSAESSWHLMQGLHPDGTPYVDSYDGRESPFFYAGDPLLRWFGYDQDPGNSKILGTSGPWACGAGDSLTLWIAIIVAPGESQSSSLQALRCASIEAQQFFDIGFADAPASLGDCGYWPRNCPRSADWWAANSAALTRFTAEQWNMIAARADSVSELNFSFPGSPPAGDYAALLAAHATARDSARREYLATVSNYVAGAYLELNPRSDHDPRLEYATGVLVPPLAGGTVGGLFETFAPQVLATTSAELLLHALEALPPGDPLATSQYRQLAAGLRELNAGLGMGPVCARQAPLAATLREASDDGMHVHLHWRLAEPAVAARVERRTRAGTWVDAGPATVDPGGSAVADFSDYHGYGPRDYRLVVGTDDGLARSDYVHLELPAAPALAMTGVWPNPGGGAARVSFTLPSAGEATLEVHDLLGRRVYGRDLGTLATGLHQVEIAPDRRLRPGVYFVVLRFGAERRTARFVAL